MVLVPEPLVPSVTVNHAAPLRVAHTQSGEAVTSIVASVAPASMTISDPATLTGHAGSDGAADDDAADDDFPDGES